MPKVSPLIPTELILRELDNLTPHILLIPEQVSMLIGSSPEQMKVDRQEGNPPPFTRQGGSIRYKLGDVRDYLRTKPSFKNDGEAHEYAQKMRALGSFPNFLNQGSLNESWPFTIIKDRPVDFFASLALSVDDESTCQWLTLEEYLNQRLRAGYQERVDTERKELETGFNGAVDLPDRDHRTPGDR